VFLKFFFVWAALLWAGFFLCFFLFRQTKFFSSHAIKKVFFPFLFTSLEKTFFCGDAHGFFLVFEPQVCAATFAHVIGAPNAQSACPKSFCLLFEFFFVLQSHKSALRLKNIVLGALFGAPRCV